jgi:OHCU decarboxylase
MSGSSSITLELLNAMAGDAATQSLLACCGSRAWAHRVAADRPFQDLETLIAAAHDHWWSLGPADWLEAFAAHPRIGERVVPGAAGSAWSAEEQTGAAAAEAATRDRLARLNDAYTTRFGFNFIVCATGKTADKMLANLEARLENEREAELRVAAREQIEITELRLMKWLTG